MAPRGGGGGSTGGGRTRGVLPAVLLGIVLGLGVSVGSLHVQRVRQDAEIAVAAAQSRAAQTAAQLAQEQKQSGATASERDTLQRRLTELQDRLKAAEGERDSAKADRDAAAAKAADSAKAAAAAERQKAEVEKLKEAVAEWRDKARAPPGSPSPTSEDRHTPIIPSRERDDLEPELAAVLRKVAINHEVFAAMSNINYAYPGGMLDTWMEGVKRAGIKNAMVIALDAATKANAEARGLTAHEMHVEIAQSQKGNGDNHAVSAMKFRVLRRFLRLGYSVFLSDVDIVVLQNPFDFLTRDSDWEGMSDGFDNGTAYGYNDVLDDASMGWARYAHSMRVFVFNSGLFYIRPTRASMDLLDQVIEKVESTNGWDQALVNEAIFFPSRPGYTDPHVKRRVLDYLLFMNSKVLFKVVRHDPRYQDLKPVTIHVNYHPDKHERMKAIVERYVNGKLDALNAFPGGSEPGS